MVTLRKRRKKKKKKKRRRTTSTPEPTRTVYLKISTPVVGKDMHIHFDRRPALRYHRSRHHAALAARGGKPIEKLPCHRALTSYSVNRLHCRSENRTLADQANAQLAYERHKVTQEELAQHFAVTSANLERAKREVDALQEAVDVVGRC
jgi:hypothetical protein